MEKPPQEVEQPDAEGVDEEDYSDASLSEVEEMVRRAVREENERQPARREPETDPLDEFDEAVRPVAQKVLSVEQRLAEMEERQEQEAIKNDVVNTINKFQMTKEEVEPVVNWLEKNPRKAQVLSFEEAALLVNPALSARRSTSRPAPRKAAEPEGGKSAVPDTVGGSGGAPSEFTPEKGVKGYHDINAWVLANEASKLGSYK